MCYNQQWVKRKLIVNKTESQPGTRPIRKIAEITGLIGVGVAVERYIATGSFVASLGNPVLLAAGGLFFLDAII